ncbi:NAD-dependent succinate-semialdehyde dehydrogenase [Rickettsiales endosymbiont of Stachyamoeba lipophora]|uniref:NAD-dependent succinate-semialdehyde dehydrogenase n=1 Tax=Rickettsiales endosymbiont of Stachyamoeba lipophora TaxID=2486578 RepID=UPI000F64EBC2|nr:NAD-dependent succinate-semialdehyde dehydrogenase [Rickettsiales endosymbiont of Stachyamoeba lipophora]AZL15129.1 NAD-dependent succinate-semialdehyde dehydrogenase [Rickettsiales endosymbiont of Stachyamoeba lipophora]
MSYLLDQLDNNPLFINQSFVNGTFIASSEVQEVLNPADNKVIGNVTIVNESLVYQAIAASEKALKDLAKTSFIERANILIHWGVLIENNLENLAHIITLEQGKTLKESRSEVQYALSYIRHFALIIKTNPNYFVTSNDIFKTRTVIHEPVGVTASITPWNFPIAMYIRKFAASFAASCPMLVKLSELTPFSALATLNLFLKTTAPINSLQMLVGNAVEIGKILTQDFRIRKLSFTGSTRVGKILMNQSSGTLKRLSMELGGNAPFVVFKDANLNKAIDMLMNGKFRNNGQSCIAINRVLIDKEIVDQFIEKIYDRIKSLKVGNGLDEQNDLGALINFSAINNIEKLIKDAKQEGATMLFGAERIGKQGCFFSPGIVTGVTPSMDIFKQEIFGPVVTITTFDNEEQVLALANQTEYGLAAYICGEDEGRNYNFATNLEFGMIGINDARISDSLIPFGGIKASGFGREGGKEGIFEYLNTKYIGF